MKGYREFRPVLDSELEPIETEEGEVVWAEKSLYENQGFVPL